MNALFFLSTWTPVFLWAGLIFFLSSIPSLNSGLGIWDFVLRKIAHMIEFAALAALLVRAIGRTWRDQATPSVMAWSGGLSVLYAISDEFHQRFVAGREGSVRDVLVDACGVALFLLFYFRWKRNEHHES